MSAAAAVIALATITAHTSAGSFPETASDAELPSEYDGDAIYRYWTQRPSTMLARSVETATLAAGFLVGLQLDRVTGKVKENEKRRARALREAVDRLGPAYIKVAQALSTRVDLLSPAYYEEITLLQDQVKPFPDDEAMEILEVWRPPPPPQLRALHTHQVLHSWFGSAVVGMGRCARPLCCAWRCVSKRGLPSGGVLVKGGR